VKRHNIARIAKELPGMLWDTAISRHGEDGLWLGMNHKGNVIVRKHGVLIEIFVWQDEE
tara:strand:+ start:184 stop:360 length:177 start_codon:yes stop_codon:yes gene_type:complete